MMVRYWQPFEEMETLRRQLDKAFEGIAAPVETTFTPAASLTEAENAYVLQLLLPGVDINTVDIQASRKTVAVSGERKAPEIAEDVRVLHSDFSYGSFRRVVNLPAGIDHENVEADYADGILTLHLPKSVENINRVVKVAINGATQPVINATDEGADA
ncbi:MAG: Hsp20/alpha crystallin family protein [Cyanobacteria bacterium P01_A01_bin.105]